MSMKSPKGNKDWLILSEISVIIRIIIFIMTVIVLLVKMSKCRRISNIYIVSVFD